MTSIFRYDKNKKIYKVLNTYLICIKMENGELRLKILELVSESKDGLTLTQISKKLKKTIYMTKSEVMNLVGLNKLEIINVGSSKLVRKK